MFSLLVWGLTMPPRHKRPVRDRTRDSGRLEAVKNTDASGDAVLSGAVQTGLSVLVEGQRTTPESW